VPTLLPRCAVLLFRNAVLRALLLLLMMMMMLLLLPQGTT
jgi:hypothetical protein